MPTNMLLSSVVDDDTFMQPPVFKFFEDAIAPGARTVDPLSVLTNGTGVKILPAGSVLITGSGAATNTARAFPGSIATAITLTSSPTVVVRDATSFKVGDVIVLGAPGSTSPVGTIASIVAATNTITLVANSATAIAVNDPIWVATVAAGQILGITAYPQNLTTKTNDVPYYVSGCVFTSRLPFWNTTIAAKLPRITLD